MVVGGIRQPGVSDTPRCISQHVADPHRLLPALHDRQPPHQHPLDGARRIKGKRLGRWNTEVAGG
eukprot:6481298-Lingulodinium_polyedra.AAC.1